MIGRISLNTMAIFSKNVSFPIQGQGETARVSDRLPLRLFSLSGCTIGRSWGAGSDMTSPFWRIYQNLDPGASVLTEAGTFPLRAGSVFVVPAWLSWRGFCQGGVRHGNALIDLPSISRERARQGVPLPLEIATPSEPLAREGMEVWQLLCRSPIADESTEARGLAWVWSVMARMFHLVSKKNASVMSHRGDFEFQRLLDYVETHLADPMARVTLARVAGVGEAELARRFQKNLKTSPAKWVRERRIAYAATLLRRTDFSMEMVAEKSGLGDRAHFSKVFARWCGCGPATWRRQQGLTG